MENLQLFALLFVVNDNSPLAIFTAGIQGKWDICKSSCASTSCKTSHTFTAAGGGQCDVHVLHSLMPLALA